MKCAICGNRSTGDVWGTPVCDVHFDQWHAEAPTAGEVCAKAPESEIEQRHKGTNIDLIQLKPGVMERVMREWTRRWVVRTTARAA